MQKLILSRRVPRHCLGLLGCFLAFPTSAQITDELGDNQLQRQQQREEAQRRQDDATPDVRLQVPVPPKPTGYPPGETPCFVIQEVKLEGDEADRF